MCRESNPDPVDQDKAFIINRRTHYWLSMAKDQVSVVQYLVHQGTAYKCFFRPACCRGWEDRASDPPWTFTSWISSRHSGSTAVEFLYIHINVHRIIIFLVCCTCCCDEGHLLPASYSSECCERVVCCSESTHTPVRCKERSSTDCTYIEISHVLNVHDEDSGTHVVVVLGWD